VLRHVPAGAAGGEAAVHGAVVRDHKLRAKSKKENRKREEVPV